MTLSGSFRRRLTGAACVQEQKAHGLFDRGPEIFAFAYRLTSNDISMPEAACTGAGTGWRLSAAWDMHSGRRETRCQPKAVSAAYLATLTGFTSSAQCRRR